MSRDPDRSVTPHERPNSKKIMEIMKFSIFEALKPDLKRISLGALRCRAMFKPAVASGLRFLTLLAAGSFVLFLCLLMFFLCFSILSDYFLSFSCFVFGSRRLFFILFVCLVAFCFVFVRLFL